jgi:molecular chaperone DnaK
MSDEEVDKLVKEAEANREADKKKKESIEARNHADSLVYQSEKTLDENKDKYEEADGTEARAKLADLKTALAKSDASKDELESATKSLSDVMMKIGQAIYAHAGDPAATPSEDKKNDDGSVEAEVEETK